jgi:signal transduction histidine kinase
MDLTQDSSFFVSLPYGACLVDCEGKVLACNPALERLLGWQHNERRGQPLNPYLQQVAEPAEALSWSVALGKALSGGQTTFLDLPARLHAGPDPAHGVAVVGAVAPWQGPEGEPLGAVVLLQDSERSESVEDARLRFLSMIAHELNSPLNIIASAADQMGCQLGQDRAGAEHLLGVIRAEVDRMERLMGSLFVPEPPARGLTWEPEAVSLDAVLQRLAARYRFAPWAGQVSVEVPADLPLAHADARVLQDGLGSLVDTFLAYAPPGSQIRFHAQEKARALLVQVCLLHAAPSRSGEGDSWKSAPWECRFRFSLPRAQGEVDGREERG